ncbi:MAG TPA: hypoxanthine phosphoribosyltransferase [Clostridia bacterium]|jgi:hypoxanthine phosphoribosyltransferase|nr:hypoxanthine phosphoribosyltransferase [Clostridia bacterium]MDD3971084.1 hypoxanthine phosphoribosyltransferase [Clostridia bacterium]NLF36001.1 hypoxanthine phosphoribosyltransferase [Clostridiaceae bacterium]HPJ76204.1 hypoxanthine phosphoribosyltransferase [Clostridia bacterium]HXK73213.1 hypoxanthine phosphoribosyltransferase [Clostridia bacterium]
MSVLYDDVSEILITKEKLDEICGQLGEKISHDYKGKKLILVGIMKGGLIFLSDLLRKISIPVEFGTVTASSYGQGTSSSGQVKILQDLDMDIRGKDVIIVEDLIDTGHTLKYLQNFFALRGPTSVKICCMLDKPSRREKQVHVDYIGQEIPDKFVVGYGMDFNEKYRNLADVCVLKEEMYK